MAGDVLVKSNHTCVGHISMHSPWVAMVRGRGGVQPARMLFEAAR